jgi:hypothetical protein
MASRNFTCPLGTGQIGFIQMQAGVPTAISQGVEDQAHQ